jgi:hypothetical protein
MTISKKKIAVAIAWGLAFESLAEMLLAGIFGGLAGRRFGKGEDADEVNDSLSKTWSRCEKIAPIVGVLGFLMALNGLLPGTKETL